MYVMYTRFYILVLPTIAITITITKCVVKIVWTEDHHIPCMSL